ncbi:hypothetical protein V6N11_064094 [Hibiscus sabdariffa]|uniref:Protein EARLY FLOWERING 4 domain-containing protein n=1 Tax=Hibiscus sabdariffa TaxID=183260 RepID=A0ABR2PMK8_9ROSI
MNGLKHPLPLTAVDSFKLCLVINFLEKDSIFASFSFSSPPSVLNPKTYLVVSRFLEMEGDMLSGFSNGTQLDGRVVQTFQKKFVQVQGILDQNRLLINEINQNHESRIPDNLSRNVGLIKELNNNIRRVVDLYADLSSSFTRSMEGSSEADSSAATFKSDGKATSPKRIRSG